MSGLLSRWQQRRDKVAKEAEQVKVQEPQDVTSTDIDVEVGPVSSATTQEVPAEQPDKILTAEDLPDPDAIEIGGSFASFMADNVDPAAKQAALRALWKQPQYNEIDGLLEYALDYSNQPKLSAEVSSELAKKVFRHMTKTETDEEQEQELTAEQDENEIEETTLAQKELAPTEQQTHNQVVAATSPQDVLSQSDELVKQTQASDEV
ncbi:DUF3306 domain-containing protein [Shewanella intestini]|uniref:DUF3306 domain-containing protein n=1 Tax=Shewanella intestini TaxID=2017544 RepID=A0ABS5I5W8_9GAMM|nr:MULTISPECIES: DUF3306 domain-containing protein [Shewanella]MBR9729306.1 DUF3306 domain-containing protein [Shewanella intestini]MRG37385.1 DUF3306 domain-containing protein [Shewanella sp. XMDDZSB0408]